MKLHPDTFLDQGICDGHNLALGRICGSHGGLLKDRCDSCWSVNRFVKPESVQQYEGRCAASELRRLMDIGLPEFVMMRWLTAFLNSSRVGFFLVDEYTMQRLPSI